MSKLTHLRQAIALCLFFSALQTRGVRLHPVVPEWKGNDLVSYDFVHGPATQNLESLKPKSIEAITFGKDSSSWDEPYFAVHQSSYGGPDDNYYGLHATMDVYGHKLKPGQWTMAAIWISHHGDGVTSSFNSIQAGWHIYPEHYGDSRPHFYTQWMRDGHEAPGCFNMDCPGFVRANGAAISPGDAIQPVSDVPHGHIQNITLRVLKDKASGDWWVYYGFNSVPTGVGYFPRSLFTYLANKANQLAFGGAVVAHREASTPPMGSGSFPNGGQGHAASFTNLGIIDKEGNSKPIMADFPTLVTNNKCHSITPINHAACLYGGPGGCVR